MSSESVFCLSPFIFHEWFCDLSENLSKCYNAINGGNQWEEGLYVRLFENVKTNSGVKLNYVQN